MKVNGTSGVGSATGARGARPGGGGPGFQLPSIGGASGAGQSSSVSGVAGVMAMDALLALQDVGGPLERKRKAVRRAGLILDVLEDVKVALLDGAITANDLDRLRRAVRDERSQTDDPKLEAVLDEVEVRAAVELAKLEQAGRAA
jgi:hypothetical protein